MVGVEYFDGCIEPLVSLFHWNSCYTFGVAVRAYPLLLRVTLVVRQMEMKTVRDVTSLSVVSRFD